MKIYIGKKPKKDYDLHLCPDENLYNGSKDLIKYYGNLSSLELDLLNFASGIYASDLAAKRDDREHYIRRIEVDIEIANYHAFERIRDKLKYALHVLSKDNWIINFIPISAKKDIEIKWSDKSGAVLLFSGGLDSMSAAANFLESNENITLVSHNTHGNRIVGDSQNNVHNLLEKHYKTSINHIHIKVYGRNKGGFVFPEDREITQRTRSFLFLTLASIVSRRQGYSKIMYMAENGQFAIHLPLNQSRIGPFSTHTADPEFILLVENVFQIILENEKLKIINPFLYLTKAEVVAKMPKILLEQAYLSVTCWKVSRVQKHCGECIPCISRRIALEYHGVKFNEYVIDLFNTNIDSLDDHNTGKINIIDYLEFISKFHNISATNYHELSLEFPELLNNSLNTNDSIEMYKRVADQSLKVFEKYPKIKGIL